MSVLTVDSTLGSKVTDHEVAAGIVNGGTPTARRSRIAAEGAKGGRGALAIYNISSSISGYTGAAKVVARRPGDDAETSASSEYAGGGV